MGFFIFALTFYFIFFLFLVCTIYLYFKLASAVSAGEEVPKWMYQFGQGFQGRYHIEYEDITNRNALKEVNLFISYFVLVNILTLVALYVKMDNFSAALYTCLKAQFAIVVASMLFRDLINLMLFIVKRPRKNHHRYSSSNAVVGAVFLTTFIFTFCIFITGFPAQPIGVQIDKTNVVVGETRASELLNQGFSFTRKNPESEIVNKRNDHFYYGELLEIVRDGQSYGLMSITPKWKDTDTLENCVVTYYEISADSPQLSQVKINGQDLSKLTITDFKTKNLTDIFSLKTADAKEVKQDTYFSLRLQTADYMLWNSYHFVANFNSDQSPYRYGVRVQHTIWE